MMLNVFTHDHSAGLCCKTGIELATYYKVVEEHPGEEDK